MKWLKSISLTLLLLVSNFGIAANYHWCAGELMQASISWGVNNLSCGMSDMDTCPKSPIHSEDDSFSSMSCCDHGSNILSVDNELRTSDVSINNFTSQFIVAYLTSIVPSTQDTEVVLAYASSPPVPSRQFLYIVYCSYLI